MLSSFPSGPGSAGVTQSPSHRVIEKEQAVTLRCDPISGHETLLWYQRATGKEITFLISFLKELVRDKSGMPADRFSAERTQGTFSTLKIQPARPEDSGVYFCASSLDTVLQSQALPARKHALCLPLATRGSPRQKSSPELHPPRRRREAEPALALECKSICDTSVVRVLGRLARSSVSHLCFWGECVVPAGGGGCGEGGTV